MCVVFVVLRDTQGNVKFQECFYGHSTVVHQLWCGEREKVFIKLMQTVF